MAVHDFSGRTTIKDGRGVTHKVSWGLYYLLLAAFKMSHTKHFGGESGRWTIYQGSFSNGAQSAGTHTGSGAVDTSPFNQKNRVYILRLLGMAGWYRYRTSYWVAHIHAIVAGDGGADRLAKAQVQSMYRGRNGLANNGADNGPRLLVHPLFVNPEKASGAYGKRWIKQNCHAYTQQTVKAPQYGAFAKGTEIETVAVTAIISGGEKTYWHITADGRCFHEANVSLTEIVAA